jgi:16S rRNA (guanine527-N7)-methyltransferase
MLPIAEIHSILQSYGLNSSEALCKEIHSYGELLLKWNQRISLTSIDDPEEIVRYHFVESFLATLACDLRVGRLADVGTGSGFPGLALKIYVPELTVTLIESSSKKCVFLKEVIRALSLDRVEVLNARYADVHQADHSFDHVCARALGNLSDLLDWASTSLDRRGRVILWIGASGLKDAHENGPKWKWEPPFSIPHTDRRFILNGFIDP